VKEVTMALKTRIGRLEATTAAARAPSARCPSCGTPAGWKPLFDVVGEDGRSVMGGCDACGVALGDNGRPLFAVPPGRGQKQFGANVDWRAV